jgi:hypothetical protein
VNLTFNIPSKRGGSQPSVVGKLGASVFFLLFGSFGVVFIFLISRDVSAKLRTYQWTQTECVITSSESVDLGKEYGFNLRYDYSFAGHLHHGTNYTVGKSGFGDYRDVQTLIARYQPGAKSICYVNPSDPTQAVLRRGSLALIPFFLLPLVFVAIGAGGIYFTWRNAEKTAAPRPVTGRIGSQVPAFFFAIFLLMGGSMTYLFFVRPLVNIQQARRWPSVPCRVITSRVQSHSGSKGGTTYSVDILYAYTVNGREYRSNRYNFLGGSSSGYGDKDAIVRRHRPSSGATCFVDPHDPTRAVLQRDFTTDMLVGLIPLVFFFIGVGGLAWIYSAGGSSSKVLPPSEGAAPWQRRADWAAGRVVASAKPAMIAAWIFTGVWNLISLPFLSILTREIARPGNRPMLFGLIFPAIGFGLIAWAMYVTARWRKYGESVLEMAPVPGVVGGALQGTIRLSRFVRPAEGFKLKLLCINRVTTQSGNKRSTSDNVLWTDEQQAGPGMGDSVPVAFYIPPDCRETSYDSVDDIVIWRLKVTAKEPGVDYAAQFDVPVFNVAQTPDQVAAAKAVLLQERAALEHYQQPSTSRIRVQTSVRGGKEFYFPALRNPGATVTVTIIFTIWSGAVWGMTHFKAPILFPILFGFFWLLILWGFLQAWSGTTRVAADLDGLTVTNKLLGIGRARTIPSGEIVEIKTVQGMRAGQTVYLDIQVICRNDRKVTAGRAIKDVQEAEWLAREMMKSVRGNS